MRRKIKLLFFMALIIFMICGCSREKKEDGQDIIEFESEIESTSDEGVEIEDIFGTETSETEISESEVLESEVEDIEISKSDIEVPEPEVLEIEVAETEVTELEVPESEVPEAEVPEPEVPETEITEPEAPGAEEPEIDDGSHYIPVSEEWNLIVVNKWNKIPEGYTVELTELSNGKKIDSRIHAALEEMFEVANLEGVPLMVREGYRTTDEQQKLLDEKIQSYLDKGYSQEQAEKWAKEWVAVPGTSEHELGLAVDINGESKYGYNQMAYKWLKENAYKFGFILRYPEGKEEITGIEHEPWHYRYVGMEAATEIYNLGICLEEYVIQNIHEINNAKEI